MNTPTLRRRDFLATAVAGAAACYGLLPRRATAADESGALPPIGYIAGFFPTLGPALGSAGLGDLLREPGPFTLFAPTEAAFARLPPGVYANLARPENQAALRALLLGHLVLGKIMAADLAGYPSLQTLQGTTLIVSADAAGLRVNRVRVMTPDMMGSNGVIHIIDRVLMPPS